MEGEGGQVRYERTCPNLKNVNISFYGLKGEARKILCAKV